MTQTCPDSGAGRRITRAQPDGRGEGVVRALSRAHSLSMAKWQIVRFGARAFTLVDPGNPVSVALAWAAAFTKARSPRSAVR